jgi:hypothetical protein
VVNDLKLIKHGVGTLIRADGKPSSVSGYDVVLTFETMQQRPFHVEG